MVSKAERKAIEKMRGDKSGRSGSNRSLNKTLSAEESTQSTADTNASDVWQPFGEDNSDNRSITLDDDGDGGDFEEFDFDDDDWNPEVSGKKTSKRKGKAPMRKRLSNRRLQAEEGDSGGAGGGGGDGFQVTYAGEDTTSAQERIRQSQMRKEESVRSMNASLNASANFADTLDDCAHGGGDDDASHISGTSLQSAQSSKASTTQERRSSMGRASTVQGRRNSMGRSGRSKISGSGGLEYGTPECEAYINSLPPAFQLSERRRLKQRAQAKDKIKQTAGPSATD